MNGRRRTIEDRVLATLRDFGRLTLSNVAGWVGESRAMSDLAVLLLVSKGWAGTDGKVYWLTDKAVILSPLPTPAPSAAPRPARRGIPILGTVR